MEPYVAPPFRAAHPAGLRKYPAIADAAYGLMVEPIDPRLASESLAYLETVGRRSRHPHVIEIWFAADPDKPRIYLLAGGRDSSDWVLNVQANARVKIRIGGRTFTGEALVIEGTDDEIRARKLVGGKYGYWREGAELRGWARDSLPVAIELDA